MSDAKDYAKLALKLHKKFHGKIAIQPKVKLETKDDLSTYYTPGVAEVCKAIAKNPEDSFVYTIRQNSVAIISDGSAVLGLGNIGALAGQPVMAGKALLFKEFGDIDAYPLVLDVQNVEQLISTIKALAPNFGGINLEDIKAPECFQVEEALQDLGIPVMHDDQHGTAVVVLAGLINACKVSGRKLEDCTLVFNGAGAAGTACARLIYNYTNKKANIILLDSKGIISKDRSDLNSSKQELLKFSNPNNISGDLEKALKGADIFIGVSKADALNPLWISGMKKNPIIFAMANPSPEIMPDLAKKAGAFIIATGRSDFPNQVNNVLAFPGIFRGALDAKAIKITLGMKLAAAEALANHLEKPDADHILPSALDRQVAGEVAKAVKDQAIKEKVTRY